MEKLQESNDINHLAQELAKKFIEIKRSDEEQVDIEAEKLFQVLYEDFPITYGKAVSRKEREDNEYTSATLVYGEINFNPFAMVFQKLYRYGLSADGGKFVDIGCGTGKPVFAAALLHDFDYCVGIEILEGLHGVCRKVLSQWRKNIRHRCSRTKFDMNISFIHGDAIHINWSDADVVFVNSTCFDETLMIKLAICAKTLRKGSFFISTTRRLPSPEFEILDMSRMPETWGVATYGVASQSAESRLLNINN
eukprot:gene7713-15783_t